MYYMRVRLETVSILERDVRLAEVVLPACY